MQVLVLGLDQATAMEWDRCCGLEPVWESLLALAVDVCFICFLERLGMVVSEFCHLVRIAKTFPVADYLPALVDQGLLSCPPLMKKAQFS